MPRSLFNATKEVGDDLSRVYWESIINDALKKANVPVDRTSPCSSTIAVQDRVKIDSPAGVSFDINRYDVKNGRVIQSPVFKGNAIITTTKIPGSKNHLATVSVSLDARDVAEITPKCFNISAMKAAETISKTFKLKNSSRNKIAKIIDDAISVAIESDSVADEWCGDVYCKNL